MWPRLQVPLQAIILGKKCRSQLEHGLGSGLSPELLGAFDASVEELHCRLHVTAGPGQSLLAITWVVHPLLVVLQVTNLLAEDPPWIVVGQSFNFAIRQRF